MTNLVRELSIWMRTRQTQLPKGARPLHGLCDLSGITARALISVSSSHSTISPDLVIASGFEVRETGRWRILPELGRRVSEKYCPGLHVDTQNGQWSVEPLLGYTGPYEIILGMDWLTKHHVLVDCAQNTLVFWAPGQLPMKATIWREDDEGVFRGNKEENMAKKRKIEDPEGKEEEEEEPFTLAEIRNDWTYHVREKLLHNLVEDEQ